MKLSFEVLCPVGKLYDFTVKNIKVNPDLKHNDKGEWTFNIKERIWYGKYNVDIEIYFIDPIDKDLTGYLEFILENNLYI